MIEPSPTVAVSTPTPTPPSSGLVRVPRVFISYAHDSDAHRELVRDLWIFLRTQGVDARIDRVAAEQRLDWTLWMQQQIAEADHVLIVASPAYKQRAGADADPAEGRGVQFEARLIRNLFYQDQSAMGRFLPVVLPGGSSDDVPEFLTPAIATVYRMSGFTIAGAEALLRVLHHQPAETEPVIGSAPNLPARDHTLSSSAPADSAPITTSSPAAGAALRHQVDIDIAVGESGVTTTVSLDGAQLGKPRTAGLPVGIEHCWDNLDVPAAGERLAHAGVGLWSALFDEHSGRRLLELVDASPVGSSVDLVFHLDQAVSWLPTELLRVPTDRRLLATVAGVSMTRRLTGIDRASVARLPGPLKILAAVAAPEETSSPNPPVAVEAEMQALLDAVTDTAATGQAQVRILEVASLAEITRALRADQYHVLHLFGHGSPAGIELEDEDGDAQPASADQLVGALKAGGHVLPLVMLSSCSGAAGGTSGLAAALVAAGADRVVGMHTTVTDSYASQLGHRFYTALAADPDTTVAAALAVARFDVEQQQATRTTDGNRPRPEAGIATLLAAGPDTPLRDRDDDLQPLTRPTEPSPLTKGVRELPLGALIGRRGPLRETIAALRANPRDRDRIGEWAGALLTGVGGIGKTAVAGRALARMRTDGWAIAEHVGTWNPTALISSVAQGLLQADATHHQQQLATTLQDPSIDDRGKLAVIPQLLSRERLLVLFDDFEQNLTGDARGFTDPGFGEIFTALVNAAQAGRLLVTCRYPIPDTDLLLPVELPPLTPAELRRLFLRLPALRALPIEDRRLVTRTIGGHPRLIEFVDALLRKGSAGTFLHVTRKLRALARDQHLDLTRPRTLHEGLDTAVVLGSRDIVLDVLLDDLTPIQHDLAMQAAMSTAAFHPDDLLHIPETPESDTSESDTAAASLAGRQRSDVDRLQELTLLSPTTGGELVMHPWIGVALQQRQPPEEQIRRHARAAQMRRRRLNTGRGGFDDLVELPRHLARAGSFDDAVSVALRACDLVGGEVAISALLAEIVPLIPVEHPDFAILADRECEALLRTGLISATEDRRENLLKVHQQRAAAHPDDAWHQHNLALSHNKVGDLAVARGGTTTAEHHFRTSLAIRERLAAADPGNAQYQRDVAVSHNLLGELAVARGDTTTAEHHFRTGLDIFKRVAAADPGNAEHQRDLPLSHERFGDLAVARGDTTTAEHHFRTSLAIRERLAAADPGNAQYQRDLALSQIRLGDVAVTRGDTTTAEHHFRTYLGIAERLTAADPGNAEHQRDLAISHERFGDLAVARGDTTTAEHHFRTSLGIAERLATADPGNAQYQRDLAISHNRLGELAVARGDTTTAEHHFRTSLAIRERLAAADPDNAGYQRDLAISHNRLGDVAVARGDTTTAEHHFRTDLAIAERLAAADPRNAQYRNDVTYVRQRLASLTDPDAAS